MQLPRAARVPKAAAGAATRALITPHTTHTTIEDTHLSSATFNVNLTFPTKRAFIYNVIIIIYNNTIIMAKAYAEFNHDEDSEVRKNIFLRSRIYLGGNGSDEGTLLLDSGAMPKLLHDILVGDDQ
jgi:hypothetical protein